MDVSSVNNSNTDMQTAKAGSEAAKSSMTKAIDVQEQQITKVLEGVQEQSKQMTAQKTGVGNNINITGQRQVR